jgi:hypothetical protein
MCRGYFDVAFPPPFFEPSHQKAHFSKIEFSVRKFNFFLVEDDAFVNLNRMQAILTRGRLHTILLSENVARASSADHRSF